MRRLMSLNTMVTALQKPYRLALWLLSWVAGWWQSAGILTISELTEGSNLRKVSILLRALEAAGKNVDYYALDLSLKELKRTLQQVPSFTHVKCHGLHGTYDDGLDWLKIPENKSRPKCVMSLGSSLGLWFHCSASFITSLTAPRQLPSIWGCFLLARVLRDIATVRFHAHWTGCN